MRMLMTVVTIPFSVSCANFNQRVIHGNQLSKSPVGCAGATLFSDEGPYYRAGSPERSSMVQDDPVTEPIVVEGQVFDMNCNPLQGAKVDFWQSNGRGQYDNRGYLLRSHQLTDGEGRYRLETVVPGVYPAREFGPYSRQGFWSQWKGSADAPDLLLRHFGPKPRLALPRESSSQGSAARCRWQTKGTV